MALRSISRGQMIFARHFRYSIAAALSVVCLHFANPLSAGETVNQQPGYEGPLRFESEGAQLLWRDQPTEPLQDVSPGHAVFEVGVGEEGKLAYRLGLWLRKEVPNPVEGTVTIAGDGLRGFNFPFRFQHLVVPGLPAGGLFWTPWTQCVGGGTKGDLCKWLDLENTKATSGSHISWAHLNRVAGISGKWVFGPDDTFTIRLMSLDGLAELRTSTTFPWPPEER
jgi:hypothetical protein